MDQGVLILLAYWESRKMLEPHKNSIILTQINIIASLWV